MRHASQPVSKNRESSIESAKKAERGKRISASFDSESEPESLGEKRSSVDSGSKGGEEKQSVQSSGKKRGRTSDDLSGEVSPAYNIV